MRRRDIRYATSVGNAAKIAMPTPMLKIMSFAREWPVSFAAPTAMSGHREPGEHDRDQITLDLVQ